MNRHLTDPAAVPDADALAAVQRFCDVEPAYRHDAETDALLVDALNAANAWHAQRSPFAAGLLRDLAPLTGVHDLIRQPFVHANFFKMHEVLSVPRRDVAVHATSSGTTGQRSQMFWDDWTLRAGRRMLARIYDHYGFVDDAEPVHYLLFTHQPKPGLTHGSSMTGQLVCDFAPAASVDFAMAHTGTGHEYDGFGAIRALQRAADDGRPVRMFGFPAFLSFTLDRMRALGVGSLTLHERSLVLLGGGWKGHADRQVPQAQLYARITEQLGVPDDRIRDGFGSVEHSIPYLECAHHHLHVPTWSRVIIRSVRDLAPLPLGERGYLQFVSPYITSVPAHSVLMGDLASLHPAHECGCDTPTPWFVVHGRAGLSRNRSCAIAAAELLATDSRKEAS